MIIFDLTCAGDHRFEGWFRSVEDFDRQLAEGMLTCPSCGSHEVRRVPSAVHIGVAAASEQKAAPVAEAAPGVRPHAPEYPLAIYHQLVHAIVSSSEDVGARFAEEARRIHYREAPVRSIHGQSSDEEFQALREEGIEVWRLPVVKKDGLN